MKIDRNWEEKKANNLIIKIFEKLGSSDKMVIDARKKMQRMLY
jgi:thioredoxin-like negative regulator of GroEL